MAGGREATVVVVVDGRAVVGGVATEVVVVGSGAVLVPVATGAVVVSTGEVVVVDWADAAGSEDRAAEAFRALAMTMVLPPRKERRLTAASPWRMRFRLMPGDSTAHLGELCQLYRSFRRVVADRPLCRIKGFSSPSRA
jgi:hypothetical protein